MVAQRIERIKASDVDAGLEASWNRLQDAHPDCKSPFFSVDFLKIVGRYRSDVRVAVLYDGQTVSGLFPYHDCGLGRGVPLAGPIADYQGGLGSVAGTDPAALLAACGLSHYDYDHALRSAPIFQQNAFRETSSPLIDLADGFDAWHASRRKATSAIKNVDRKLRKLEREVGPVRFVAEDTSQDAWAQMLAWKRDALLDLGVSFIFDTAWVKGVIETIRDTHDSRFSGRFSTLYAGDQLVAAHFGMRSATAWHWWFPTFAPDMSAYTPGLGLLMHCARQATEDGLAEIDLGRGNERYKREFANGTRALCEGSLERPAAPMGAVRALRKSAHKLAEGRLPDRHLDLSRRAFNRLLRVGRL